MDQLTLLTLLCFSMLVGSYFSGTIPMAFPLSESKSKLLTITGSGILVGTALSIIIPEGINSIYSETPCARTLVPSKGRLKEDHPNSPSLQDYMSGEDFDDARVSTDDSNINHRTSGGTSQTFVIGFALVSGFVLMLLIDQFSVSHQHTHSVSHNQMQDYTLAPSEDDYDIKSCSQKDRDSLQVPISSINHQTSQNLSHSNLRPIPKVTPTLGLVIHASADGIALGAAATTSHREIEMIIFLAIMLHKAPAAFGLVAFLLHRGLSHTTIRRHLLAFSLSAPIAAFITYFGLSQSGKEALQRHNATGIAMLFSAGTFLYVATVHVLPEIVHNRRLSLKEILCFIVGAFLPSLLAQAV